MSHKRIFTIFVGLCCILCLAKQNFEITLDRAEISDVDPEIIEVSYAVNRYNRTFKTLSINLTVLITMDYDVNVKVQGYAMFSNEYKRVPFVIKRNLCDFFNYEFLLFKRQIEKYSHYPTECPIHPGDYYLIDFVPNGADFPAAFNIPWTKFMFHVQEFYKDKLFVTLKLYLTLDHDAQLKREG